MNQPKTKTGAGAAPHELPSAVADEKYFYAKSENGRIHTRGEHRFARGHQIQGSQNLKADGVFSEWDWDGSKLTVRNDRYGFQQLFYFCRENEICVSPSIFQLIAQQAPVEIDYTALAVFLRLGYFIGEDTPFKDIRAVPPDAAFEWRNGQLRASGKYTFGAAQNISGNGALDAYISLFRQSIKRRLPVNESFTVPLSGGRDSRHILLELCEQGYRPPFCPTLQRYPPRSNEDERVAAQVTGALNIEHIVLFQEESRFSAELRKNWATNFCSDEHAWYMAIADYLQGKVHTLYDGIGGVLSATSMFLRPDVLDLFQTGHLSVLARRMFTLFGRYHEDFLLRLLGKDRYDQMGLERAVDHLAEELKKHTAASDPVRSFHFWNRTRREIALVPYGLFKNLPQVYSPYLDGDLFDFLTTLPVTVLSPNLLPSDKNFHAEAIRRAYPRYSHLPFEDKEAKKTDARQHYAQLAAGVARYVLPQLRSPLRTMNRSYVFPRLAFCLANRRYREKSSWVLTALYLFQLEKAVSFGQLAQRQNFDR